MQTSPQKPCGFFLPKLVPSLIIVLTYEVPRRSHMSTVKNLSRQNFTRHETWAEQAKDWISYVARSSYLLQQGDYVADIAYFYGEEAVLFNTAPPAEIPRGYGYGYDFVSADAILTQMSVVDLSLIHI